jgi:hypothetical protein
MIGLPTVGFVAVSASMSVAMRAAEVRMSSSEILTTSPLRMVVANQDQPWPWATGPRGTITRTWMSVQDVKRVLKVPGPPPRPWIATTMGRGFPGSALPVTTSS